MYLYSFVLINIMADDDLAMQKAPTSAAYPVYHLWI